MAHFKNPSYFKSRSFVLPLVIGVTGYPLPLRKAALVLFLENLP
jgi:hypothetical protein